MKIAALAKKARQSLGRGLEALQAGDAPERLIAVAQPLAKAMGTLVEMETAAPELARKASASALAALREGLQLLQAAENAQLPAAEAAMTAVAEALGVLRQIEESSEGAAKAGMGKTQLAGSAAQPAPSASLKKTVVGEAPPPAKPATVAAAAPAAAPAQAPVPVAAAAPAQAPVPPSSKRQPDSAMRAVDAALGAHSATNFYKGLAGGDIVASGGLFVATYQMPDVGQELLLKVTMPGGYAFEAKGVVAWRREVNPATTASGSPPGFGAQFSEISDEGRGLIQRYVRNREPLFHDDA